MSVWFSVHGGHESKTQRGTKCLFSVGLSSFHICNGNFKDGNTCYGIVTMLSTHIIQSENETNISITQNILRIPSPKYLSV